jgi:hypothetical protein
MKELKMGLATHLGPWLLGTVKNTTGTTAGTIRNTGVTSVGQTDPVAYNDAASSVAVVIPAGAIITNIALYQTTKFAGTSGVITIYLNGTAIAASSAITAGASGIISLTPASDAQVALFANVGATDAIITYTVGSSGTFSAGVGFFLVEYLVRNADGSSAPTAFTA